MPQSPLGQSQGRDFRHVIRAGHDDARELDAHHGELGDHVLEAYLGCAAVEACGAHGDAAGVVEAEVHGGGHTGRLAGGSDARRRRGQRRGAATAGARARARAGPAAPRRRAAPCRAPHRPGG